MSDVGVAGWLGYGLLCDVSRVSAHVFCSTVGGAADQDVVVTEFPAPQPHGVRNMLHTRQLATQGLVWTTGA
jgi:hypothetical protein